MSRRYGLILGLVLLVAAAGVGIYLAGRVGNEPAPQGAPPPVPVVAKEAPLPGPGSELYERMVGAFYGGLAALEVDAHPNAKAMLGRATELVPGEPAAWADLGLLRIRLGDLPGARADLERASSLAPENGAIEAMLGELDRAEGHFAGAIGHFRRAVERAPDDLRARYALAEEIERESGIGAGAQSAAEPLRLLGEILARQPDNLQVLFDRARLAAKQEDVKALTEAVEGLGRFAPGWPEKTRGSYAILKASVADPRKASLRVAFLRNVLVRSPAFQKGIDAVKPLSGTGTPIRNFLRLPLPSPTPSPPDQGLAFDAGPISEGGGDHWDTLLASPMTGEGPPSVLVANAKEWRRADGAGAAIPFPGGTTKPSPHALLAADLNGDFRLDLVAAGGGGIAIYQQKPDGGFADVSAATKLDASLIGKPAHGAWAADLEMDGDLDVVLGLVGGPATALRNNGDGTFRPITPFEGAADLRDFAWADLDQDGDPDAATLDAGGVLRVFANERAGVFRLLPIPPGLEGTVALTTADVDGDGDIDLLALDRGGTVRRVIDRDEGRSWEIVPVAKGAPAGEAPRLFAADLDNNGATDLVASAGWFALGDGRGRFGAMRETKSPVSSVVDLDGDGLLDLAGLDGQGRPARGKGRGSKGYHWQVIRPRRTRVEGDGRINTFGVGGLIQVRARLLVQTQTIAGPAVHFGLGANARADAARVVWPNGTTQGEFEMAADQAIGVEQRLKGSCPFLYAFDGTRVEFVTDAIWRSPLGLRINAQDTAGSSQTEDWVKIRGDQLAVKDGRYDLRVTAELWETHYWDHFALMVVDHPKGTEVFVDERFAREPPKLAVHATGPLLPIRYARDDNGNDVTETVRVRDCKYLDTFGRGQYQGVTRDHWVEIEIGDDVPSDRPLYLVAQGWIHPTDSSINVALAQGSHEPPRGLALEVVTADAKWDVARPDLGFPAGKNKTILIDLGGVFRAGASRRLRLRTNLEVFWDRLAVAVAAPETTLKTRRLAAASAELRYRGFSRMTQADASSPELPDYDVPGGTTQRWRDLIGNYTRFGDVRELLKGVDDRYVIANAGDELALRFEAPAGPEAGWVRDFILIGDGWNKDGDYNTAFSKTVLPLPSHGRPAYDTPPGALDDDPVYRAHPGDWAEFHTRYITPDAFQRGLGPGAESHP